MKALSNIEKQKVWTAGTKNIKFIQSLKRHVQIGDNVYTARRAAFALILLDEYINGEFLEKIQNFALDQEI